MGNLKCGPTMFVNNSHYDSSKANTSPNYLMSIEGIHEVGIHKKGTDC